MNRMCSLVVLVLVFANPLFCYEKKLSIGMIFKNEAPYLKEWIEYHLLVGVECFYLYNDGSTDAYKQVLSPYVKKGIVILSDAVQQPDFNGTQVDCYNRTLIQTYGKCKWVAMIDSDEFLVTSSGIKILDLLDELDSFAGVMVNWRNFGTSNIDKIPSNKLMIECLTHCAEDAHPMNSIVKCIVRPDRVRCFGGPHWPELTPNRYCVDTDGVRYTPPAALFKLWINHYWTRDKDFLINVKIPRSIPWGRTSEGVLSLAASLNASTDTTILRHVPQLRKKIFAHKKSSKSKLRQKKATSYDRKI